MLLEPFVHRSHLPSKGWNGNHSQLPRVSMQFLQQRGVLRPPDTDLHKRTSVHLWAWFAHQQSSWLHNTSWVTPCSSQFPQVWQMMCCVLDNTWTPYFQSATFSLLQRYMDRGHLHVISNLHHHRLTSLQTYVIVKSQHTLTTTIQSSARQCKLLDSQNADVLADSVSCWYCVGFCLV